MNGWIALGVTCLTAFQTAADQFIVTNANDSGAGSLRQAILDANANPGLDEIVFNVPDAAPLAAGLDLDPPQVQIDVQLAMPVISDPLAIRGFTQPGSAANTSSNDNNATIAVVLDGAQTSAGTDGLVFGPGSGGSTLEGLGIRQFPGNGVVVSNVLGVNVLGGYVLDNDANGIAALSGSVNIGDRTPGARMLVSGNGANGVILGRLPALGKAFAKIEGTFIGREVLIVLPRGNKLDGVRVDDSEANVGETADGAANVISGNGGNGIHVTGDEGQVTARDNHIGTDGLSQMPMSNGGSGALLEGGVLSVFEQNEIGFNVQNGITTSGTADFYQFVNNRIFGHVLCGLAVDINDDGVSANDAPDVDNAVNFPIITGVSTGLTTAIFGSYTGRPNSTLQVQVYANEECGHHGHGEAEVMIAATTANVNSNGVASWLATMNGVPPHPILSAMATVFDFVNPPKSSEMGPCFDRNLNNTILTITQTIAPNPVEFNGQFTYTWDIANTIRDITADNLRFEFTGPAGFTTVGAGGDGWTFSISNNTARGTFPSVPAGTSAPPPFVTGTLPGQSGSFINEASIEADNARRVTVGGIVTIQPGSRDLAVSKVPVPDSVTPGGGVTYLITVTNNGPDTAPEVGLLDQLDPGATLVAIGGTGWNCLTGGIVTAACEHGPLGPGEATAPLTIIVTAPPQPGVFSNVVAVTALGDPVQANNTAVATVLVVEELPLACFLEPNLATNQVQSFHSVTVTVARGMEPQADVPVTFEVISGPNAPATGADTTDASGQATFQYLGGGTPGTDIIRASGDGFSCQATKVWIAAPSTNQPPVAVCTNVTRQAGAGGTASVTPNEVDGGSFDPDGTIMDRTLDPPGPFPVGTNSVTLKVTDNDGAMDTCEGTIIVTAAPPTTVVFCIMRPETDTNVLNETHTIIARVLRQQDGNSEPISDLPVDFAVIAGPNQGTSGTRFTDALGDATFSYVGNAGVGTDTIVATGTADGQDFECSALKVWRDLQADLAVTKQADDNPVGQGQEFHYTITVTNRGPDSASAVEVMDALPLGIIFKSAVAPVECQFFPDDNGLICQLGSLPANTSTTIVLVVESSEDAFGDLINTVVVDATEPDPDLSNNEAIEAVIAVNLSCVLSPTQVTNAINTAHSVTATVLANGQPAAEATVVFQVLSGPNAGQTQMLTTDANGQAVFTYTSNGATGTDVIAAFASFEQSTTLCQATKTWASGPQCSVSPASSTNDVGRLHEFTVTVLQAGQPVSKAPVEFAVILGPNEGVHNQRKTRADGTVTFLYPSNGEVGEDTILVTADVGGVETLCSASKFWSPLLACSIVPVRSTNLINTAHAITVTVRRGDAPVAGANVEFFVTGPNSGTMGTGTTDANGQASFNYTGNQLTGEEVIRVDATADGQETLCRSEVLWKRKSSVLLDELIGDVQETNLSEKSKKKLIKSLEGARKSVDKDKPDAANKQMGKFGESLLKLRQTMELDAETADALDQTAVGVAFQITQDF